MREERGEITRGVLCAVCCVLGAGMAEAATAVAHLAPTSAGSTVQGDAALTEVAEGMGLSVNVTISGAPPGPHGLHIHEFGGCEDGGKAAGGHFNPQGAPHGFLPKDGSAKAHAGDMGNIEIGPDGTGTLEVVLPGVTLSGGATNVAGRAVILHEKADDFGQPAGNAGGRIGCGPIVITGQ